MKQLIHHGKYYIKPFAKSNFSGIIFLVATILCAKLLEYAYSTPEPYEMLIPGHVMAMEPALTAPVADPSPKPSQKPTKARVEPNSEVRAIIERYFGDEAEKVITMVAECENKSWNPKAVNWNKNGTWDAGYLQINQVHGYSMEYLFDAENNIKAGYKIYKDAGYSFSPWSCSHTIGVTPFYLK